MTDHPLYPKLAAFMDAAVRVLPQAYNPDCCIAATRIVKEVLTPLRFKVRPLTVEAFIANPAMTAHRPTGKTKDELRRWQEETGAWLVTIGERNGQKKQPKKWVGHLVAIVNETFMIDLSLPQAARPDHDIRVSPILALIDKDFLLGDEPYSCNMNGCRVEYYAHPADRSFAAAPDWQRNHAPAVSVIRQRMPHERIP